MLQARRVLDLSDEKGLLCGQIMADLGADVLQIEPPGGSSARAQGPWRGGQPDPEGSLFWWAYARGKRGAVLDIASEGDRERLRQLAREADFFVESERPGRLASLGLGYEDLAALNPGLIYVSISPFGQTGPKAGHASTDLTAMASGGALFLSGERDTRPVRVQSPQAYAHAGADAAVGALIAHFARKQTGRGQHVDVSAQQSVTLATMFRSLDAPLQEAPARRISGGAVAGGVLLRTRYEAADGWVTLGPVFLPSTGHFMTRLLAWIGETQEIPTTLRDEEWGQFALRLIRGERGEEDWLRVETLMAAFFRQHPKALLMCEAVKRKLLLAPVMGLDELLQSDQLAERGAAVEILTSEQGTIRVPGPFARLPASPLRIGRPAPRLDEHGAEPWAEPRHEPLDESRAPASRANGKGGPLAGIKILDLFWVLAGPCSTRLLADYGATVVRVESTNRLDTLRVIPPYQFNNPHPDGAGAFHTANANKLSLTLNLGSEEGRELALELAAWADVATESFSPGVIESYGLGWEALRERNPGLILISSSLMGQTGPWRDFTGFGNLAASVTGFQQLASFPGRPPSGPYGAYTDFIAARYNAVAILAALEHRERTGEGQHVDMAQGEAALHFLAPTFLDVTVNGTVPEPRANDDWICHPHDVFPCAGKDRWVAIAVRNDEEWRHVCQALGHPEWEGRRGERAAAAQALGSWTAPLEMEEVEARLQARGVPAAAVLDTPALFEDPHLQARGHFQEVAHDLYQTSWVESSRLRLSDAPARVPSRACHAGADNRAVLEGLLGHSAEQIAAWAERGVLS
ncbi:MAG: CoA transferase [Deltaproteobacteria bacterium]|nr:CoA transferase [Deltaproteobacteria bacterium]